MNKLLENLWEKKSKFIQMNEMEEIAKGFYYNYKNMINYLIKSNQIIKIFKDYYYVKDNEEIQNKNMQKYKPLELLSKALEFQNVGSWYFGLHTSLRKLNIPTQQNSIDYLMCVNLPFSGNKLQVLGKEVHLITLNKKLSNFGIIEDNIRYSNLEKTILDFIYLWKKKGTQDLKIMKILNKYKKQISKEKILDYSLNYSKNIIQIIEDVFI